MIEGEDFPEIRGGCQCGAVRYTIAPGPAGPGICHCRMCQRATGNAFAPLHEVPRAAVTWEGRATEWASSDRARRGFCATCGTPLYYASGETIEFMAGSFAPGAPFRPRGQHGIESRVDWLGGLITLPAAPTRPEIDGRIRSHQAPE